MELLAVKFRRESGIQAIELIGAHRVKEEATQEECCIRSESRVHLHLSDIKAKREQERGNSHRGQGKHQEKGLLQDGGDDPLCQVL